MNNSLKLAIVALICASTFASAQTKNSNSNGKVSKLSNYLTADEQMTAIEQDILQLTNDLLKAEKSKEKSAIQLRIAKKQEALMKLKSEKKKKAEVKAENRTINLYHGDLIKNDLPMKSFRKTYDTESKQLTLTFQLKMDHVATIRILTPGKEILKTEVSTGENGRHTLVVDLSNSRINTYCVNVESEGKQVTKMVSL